MSVSLIALRALPCDSGRMAVFRVPLPHHPDIFMSVTTQELTDRHRVVIVDAQALLALSRASPDDIHREQAWGTPETWRVYYKYKRAASGFARGLKDPVPLSSLSYNVKITPPTPIRLPWWRRKPPQPAPQKVAWVNIGDGATRTIWLLSHGCQAFPVMCYIPGVLELHQAAGIKGTRILTQQDLDGAHVW